MTRFLFTRPTATAPIPRLLKSNQATCKRPEATEPGAQKEVPDMTPSASSSPTLVGRGREQQELLHLLTRLQSGSGRFVLIGGEAGIGKTTLVQDLTERARERSIPVFAGACYDLETTPPYGPWLNSGILERSAKHASPAVAPTLTVERQRIIGYLEQNGTSRPSDVASELGMSPNAANQALRRLLEEGLVSQPSYGTYAAPAVAGQAHSEAGRDSLLRRLYDQQERSASGTQQSLFRQILNVLTELCRAQPTVLILEDIHWSDQASIELLRFIVREIKTLPLLLITTYRDVDLSAGMPLYRLLPQIVREGSAERLSLSRFSKSDIRDLVNRRYALSSDDEERLVDHLFVQTEGNPFFVDEVLRALVDGQRLTADHQRWTLGDLSNVSIPLLVRQLIDGRIEELSDQTRELLQLAAIIGAEFSLYLLQQISGASDESLLEAIDEALTRQIIEHAGDSTSMRFRHALVREAFYAQIPLLRRRVWHRQIAKTLALFSDPDPDDVAYHLLEAQDLAEAADWLIRAAERAALAFAFQIIIERYEQALRILERDEDRIADRAWILCDLAEAYRYIDVPRALRYVETAFGLIDRLNDPALETVVRWTHAHLRGFTGENAIDELEDALERFQQLDPADRARIDSSPVRTKTGLGVHGQRLAHHGQFKRAMGYIQEFLARQANLETPGRETELAVSYYGLGMCYSALGEPLKALDALGQARLHAIRAENDHLVAATLDWEYDHVYHVYFPENRSERLKLIVETDRAWQRSVYSTMTGVHEGLRLYLALFLEGRWDEIRTSATANLGSGSMRMKCLASVAEIERFQGNATRAWNYIGQALPDGPDSEPGTIFFFETLALQRTAADLALDLADLEVAERWILAQERWLSWSDVEVGRWAPELLRARFYEIRGDLDLARAHAATAYQRALRPNQPLGVLRASRSLGHLEIRAGHLDVAAEHIEASLRLSALLEAPYEIALSQLGRAELLIAEGQLEEARTDLSTVESAGRELGASPLLLTVGELTALLSTTNAESVNLAGLSSRELDVVRLVSKGMTDAEIRVRLSISTRTVSGHLQSIFNKLGVSSRTAVTAYAYEHRLV